MGKFFDSAPLHILLTKLPHLGFDSNSMLIADYLNDKTQCKVESIYFQRVLGPLFFVLFLNDFPYYVFNS